MERDPFAVLEGIALAGFAIGAQRGFVYVRSEYPRSAPALKSAVLAARAAGLLGTKILGSDFSFDIEIVEGAGSYVCGEETALLRSLEGLRGMVTARPPYPADKGLFERPTIVNNVETLANVGWIVRHGGDAYAKVGVGKSRGTKAVSLNERFVRPGVYEVPLGVPLREILDGIGGGMKTGRPMKAVQVGGPLGGILPARLLDAPLGFEELAAVGALLGHGGIVAWDDTVDVRDIAIHLFEFCDAESCGKCFPCRIGGRRGLEIAKRLKQTRDHASDARGRRASRRALRDARARLALRPWRSDPGSHPIAGDTLRVRDDRRRAMSGDGGTGGTEKKDKRKLVTLTIDGREVKASDRATILDVARREGIFVPTLCYDPAPRARSERVACAWSASPARAAPSPRAPRPVREGMVIDTKDETATRVAEGRRRARALRLSRRHPRARRPPPTAPRTATSSARSRATSGSRRAASRASATSYAKDDRHPYIKMDLNECIVCGRCVRACDEIQGTFALAYAGRGWDTKIVAGMDSSFTDSACVSCGACVSDVPHGRARRGRLRREGHHRLDRDDDVRVLRRRLLARRERPRTARSSRSTRRSTGPRTSATRA